MNCTTLQITPTKGQNIQKYISGVFVCVKQIKIVAAQAPINAPDKIAI